MKYNTEIVIDADPATVWAAFDNPDNMRRWQPTLKSFTQRSGEPGQPGAVAELVYDENGRNVVLTERITERRDPDFMAGSYESAWGTAVIVNHFEAMGENQTRWVSYWNHKFRGFFKLLVPFMKNSMCRRLDDDMQRFKLMVESDLSGNSE